MGSTKREALRRHSIAACAAQRLEDIRVVLEREMYAVNSLGISTDPLSAAVAAICETERRCSDVSKECEAALLGKAGGK